MTFTLECGLLDSITGTVLVLLMNCDTLISVLYIA